MAKVINITDKFQDVNPVIKIGDKEYPIDDSVESVLKFEELAGSGSSDKMIGAIEAALGKEAAEELGLRQLSISKFKVLIVAVMAAMQDMSYEEAATRFRKQ